MIPVPMACWRTIRAVACPRSSEGPYPLTTIWTTAGDTFEMTVSRELSKARSKFDDAGAFEMRAGASAVMRTAVDCACAEVAASRQAIPYFIFGNFIIV